MSPLDYAFVALGIFVLGAIAGHRFLPPRATSWTVRCNRGHESPRALWNCPVCTDPILDAVRRGDLERALDVIEDQSGYRPVVLAGPDLPGYPGKEVS